MRLVLERDGWSRVDAPPPGGVDTADAGARIPDAGVHSGSAAPMVAGTATRLGAGSGRSRYFRCWSVGRACARPGCRAASGFGPAAAGNGDDDTDGHRLAQRTVATRRAVEI